MWLRSTNQLVTVKMSAVKFCDPLEGDVSSRLQFLEKATLPWDRIWYNLTIILPFVVSTTILLLQVTFSLSSSHNLPPPLETHSCYFHLCHHPALVEIPCFFLSSAQANSSAKRCFVRNARSSCLFITAHTQSQVLKLIKRPAIKAVTGDRLISLDCGTLVTTHQTTAGI